MSDAGGIATHNANIPVFGDAEWIGVLQEEDGRSKLLASGSIDAPQVKELAANILEGAREAFTRLSRAGARCTGSKRTLRRESRQCAVDFANCL